MSTSVGQTPECAVCLEVKPMRAFPHPECIHRYCMDCLPQLLDSQKVLFPACPECRRPALADNGTPVTSISVVRGGDSAALAQMAPSEGRMRRVLARCVVRGGPEPSAVALGELQPGDYVEVLERSLHKQSISCW